VGSALQGMTGAAAMTPAGGPPKGDIPTGSMPDVMTPAEAAGFLKVSEEDVVAAINSGDLKAKKIGNAFRISKEALQEFLKG
jgi:excisionase family DNA binding protein